MHKHAPVQLVLGLSRVVCVEGVLEAVLEPMVVPGCEGAHVEAPWHIGWEEELLIFTL
jgi:hypothetical protein